MDSHTHTHTHTHIHIHVYNPEIMTYAYIYMYMKCIPIHTNTYDSVIISITHGEGNKQTSEIIKIE